MMELRRNLPLFAIYYDIKYLPIEQTLRTGCKLVKSHLKISPLGYLCLQSWIGINNDCAQIDGSEDREQLFSLYAQDIKDSDRIGATEQS